MPDINLDDLSKTFQMLQIHGVVKFTCPQFSVEFDKKEPAKIKIEDTKISVAKILGDIKRHPDYYCSCGCPEPGHTINGCQNGCDLVLCQPDIPNKRGDF